MIASFYINLDRSVVRRRHMEQTANVTGIALQRLPAVDGQEMSDTNYERFHPLVNNRRRMTKSEVACFLSHRKAWETICRGTAEYGAIFEDDVLFGTALSNILLDSTWIRTDMEIIKLDKATRKHIELGERVPIKCYAEARRLLSLHVGCGGYIVSKAMAKRLINESQIMRVPVDHFLFNPGEKIFKEFQIWQLSPSVCLHQQFSAVHFLPKRAELSSLQVNRKKTIRSHQRRAGSTRYFVRKLIREVSRPFFSFGIFFYMKATCYIRGTSWERISFRKD